MELKILNVTVITGRGADKISIDVDLPNPCWPYDGNATLALDAAKGTGVTWVRTHLKLEPRIIALY